MTVIHYEIKDKRIWLSFVWNVSLIILLFVLSLFLGLFLSNKRLIESDLLSQARGHFTNIVLTRRWNASFGGVYVEKKPGVVSNPYLKNPDITTIDGRVFTKKNPALMTREISVLADQDGRYQFHITSLKPRNPDNAPDDFERSALEAFERGVPEVFSKTGEGRNRQFRYMAPLMVEDSCLTCHADQGYRVGDVRGGISVRFPIAEVERALRINGIIVACLFVATLATLLGMVYFFIIRLSRSLAEAQRQVREMAERDGLTGLYNRRHFFLRFENELARARRYGRSLACILIDLDFFKQVNDNYGHQTGDQVLKHFASILAANTRQSDTAARYGGEEFILLLPETDEAGAMAMAEKLRALTESQTISLGDGSSLHITASLGVVAASPAELTTTQADQLVQRADQALYRAKDQGRNQVCSQSDGQHWITE